jgi:signal transduction histidine kinase
LDDLGLAPAIERIASDIQSTGVVSVMVDVASIAGKRFDEHLETAVFRLVQEALTNIVKHSKAVQASISIRQGVSTMEVVVEDDGCGIDLDKAARMTPTAGHLGLIGMRERTTLLGGEFRIERLATGGTRVSATFPVGELAT